MTDQEKHTALELRALEAIDKALRSVDEQLMAGHIETARNVLHYAIADAKLLRTLFKNRPEDATNHLESQQLQNVQSMPAPVQSGQAAKGGKASDVRGELLRRPGTQGD